MNTYIVKFGNSSLLYSPIPQIQRRGGGGGGGGEKIPESPHESLGPF